VPAKTEALPILRDLRLMEPTVDPKAAQKPRTEETPLEAFSSICSVLVIGLFVLTFIFQNFVIPSGSMEKTLLIGDHVLVDRVTLAPPPAGPSGCCPMAM